MKTGRRNKISDVSGVTVGHYTLSNDDIQTGVTVILPSADNPFKNKLTAASFVINGFAKTAGLIQIDELGQLESPIGLTNTLCVGRVHDALVSYMIERCRTDNTNLQSINVVVAECNDSKLNAITHQSIEKRHVYQAIAEAKRDFDEGAVGAGRGMICHGLKGGIGSSSRIVQYSDTSYTLGVLVLANHGLKKDLIIKGEPFGKKWRDSARAKRCEVEQGSIIVVLACDAPLNARQLKRIAKRATAGIARTGSHFGHGSGDIVIAFSTANRMTDSTADSPSTHWQSRQVLHDSALDILFRAAIGAVEESVISALYHAESLADVPSLRDWLNDSQKLPTG